LSGRSTRSLCAVVAAAAIGASSGIARCETPAYIEARPDAIVKMFGAETAARIFSDALTPMRRQAVIHSVKHIPGFDCPADPKIALVDVIPYPVKPGAVSWVERFLVACAPRAQRSFLLLLDGEQVRIAELLPGFTIIEPTLQRDASQAAKTAARSLRPPGCDKTVIIDTRVATPPPARGSPWTERWTYDQCGSKGEVELTFRSSSQGAGWDVKLVK